MIEVSKMPVVSPIPEVSRITKFPGVSKMIMWTTSKNQKGLKESRWGLRALHTGPVLVATAMILALSFGAATAQTSVGVQTAAEAQADARARDNARLVAQENAELRANREATYAYALARNVWTTGGEGSQVPQDIRIMQRIVNTALSEAEAPELPDALKASGESSTSTGAVIYTPGDDEPVIMVGDTGGYSVHRIGGRDVTGFYMQGYGYLFTVKWQVSGGDNRFVRWDRRADRLMELTLMAEEARLASTSEDEAAARAAGEAERTLEQERDKLEVRQQAWEEWAAVYRDTLAETLRDVVALYGSTLKRATPEEAITFIADFGGGDEETVTVTTRRGRLTGASRDENLAAVEMSKGEIGVSAALRTELKIMAEIIDSSLQVESTGDNWTYSVAFEEARYFGGDSSFQYVPGYGVLFYKGARLNMATQLIRRMNPDRRGAGVNVEAFRDQIDEGTEEQRQAYIEHLANLKEQTAEILATYGPTLTGMNDNDWVGVFYNVGSAAGLLEGGISNFLVQARMADVRQAGLQADGAAWLLGRLVTNEKQD